MASNFDAILAQTNPQALAVHTGYSSFAPAPSAPKPQAPAPQSSLFHSIAQAALHNKAEHVVGSAGKGLVTSTIGAAQTVGRAGIVNPARLGAAEITHNTTALNNVGKSIVQNTPSKVIGAGLQTASLALPGGGKIGETVGAKVLPAALARATAVGAKAAPAGALFGAGQGISEGKKPLQVAKGAAVGGLTAGALGGAGSLLGSTISKVKGGPLPLPRKSPEINATPVTENKTQIEAGKGSVQNTNTSEVTAYHGSTNEKLTSLMPGAKTGLNEKRNLIYLSEDKNEASNYAKNRGPGGLGELTDSKTGKVYPVKVTGQVLDAQDRQALNKLKSAKGYDQLSGKTKNLITNDTGLDSAILEANPQLRQFLSDNDVSAVRSHLPNGGGGKELAVINPNKITLQNTNLHPDTKFASDYLKNNLPKATKDYQERTMKEFGTSTPNIVSGDEAKFVVPNFTAGKSGHYHEPASTFAKDYYKQLLADPATKDKPVLITGGGAGAGKTSGLRATLDKEGGNLGDYAAVNDTNLTDMKSAENRIQPALKSGRNVEINYVYRDPVDSFVNGNIPRAERTGRVVPIETHAETHAGSLDTIKQVAEKYKDDPRVSINIVDNSRGAGKATVVPLDFLKNKSYNKEELTKVLHNELEQAKSKIKPEIYDAYKSSQETSGTVRPPAEQPSEKNNLSKVGKSVQQKAVERGLKDTYGDSASYEKISLADQAKKAVDLTNDRPELEKVISGEKPLPNGLRATALVKAVEDHPVLGKDPELLNKLSKSDLTTESSQSAQELRLARERNPDSVTARLNEVRKAKMAAVEAKLKTPIAKAITSTAKEAKGFIPKVKADEWSNFVESLKC